MTKREVVVNNRAGMDSKPAAMFIQKTSNYKSSIWIEKDERKANAKSLLGLLSLGIGSGTKISIIAEGEDEERAVNDLMDFVISGMQDES